MTINKFKFAFDVKYFLIGFLTFIIISGYFLINFSKSEIHLAINSLNSEFSDFFFKYFTHLADGATIVIIGLIVFYFKPRLGLQILISYIISGLIAQIFKRYVFDDIVRPALYFKEIAELHFIDGVKMLNKHSFPSGHSTSAFAFFLSFAFFTKNRTLHIIFFLLALLVAYSRVYLSQHFLSDITVGAVIGVVTSIFCYYFIGKLKGEWLDKRILFRNK